jgi:hypothetical protein
MAAAIVPEVVEEKANARYFIRQGRGRIAAGVSLEKPQKLTIEARLVRQQSAHLRELDGASRGFISDHRGK